MLGSLYTMIKTLVIFAIIMAIAGLAWFVVTDPGQIVLDWHGYHVSTSVAVGLALVLLFAIVVALLYRIVGSILRVPRAVSRANSSRRRRKGVKALGKGLAAIAAGDAATAKDQADRASGLLDDRALTLLLQAQAAQLQGDDTAAQRYFKGLSEWPSTEFLGIRGLLTQALQRQEWDEALSLAKRAYRINRKSEWVVRTLFDLQKRKGQWSDARETLKDLKRLGAVSRDDHDAEEANLLYQQSLQAQGSQAIALAKKAFRERPALTAAGRRMAELMIAEGNSRGAAKWIEEAWEREPDPALAELYWEARGLADPANRLDAAQRLAMRNPNHPESRLLLGIAALDAGAWAAARDALEPLANTDPTPRVCRLMASLEERQHGDMERAHDWLVRAAGGEILPPRAAEGPAENRGEGEPPVKDVTPAAAAS